MSAEELDARMSGWLERVEARWRRTGLDAVVRARLLRELVVDLRQALASGAPAAELVQIDPTAFADRVAEAAGAAGAQRSRAPRARTWSLLGGCVVGAVLSALVVYRAVALVEDLAASGWFAALVAQVVAPLLVAAGAWLAAWTWQRPGPDDTRLLVFAAAGMGLVGLLGVWPSMALTADFGLHGPEQLVGAQVLMAAVLGGLGALTGIAVAQSTRWRR